MIADVFVGLVFAAAAALVLQIANAVDSLIDAAAVRDSDEPDALTRTRARELVWALAVLAPVAVFIAFGVDGAARSVWTHGQALSGVALLFATAIAAFLAGAAGVLAMLRRERPTYARLRRDLRDRSTFTVSQEELASFDDRLARADALRARRPVTSLSLQITGLVLVTGVGGVMSVSSALAGSSLVWWVGGAMALEIVAFIVALRASAVHRERIEEVFDAQRDEVVAMLERARIPQRGRVPGLRDRVSRALAILREQQR